MDIWEATEFDSFEDCLERAKSNWTQQDRWNFAFAAFIQFYFARVLWQHYRNSHLTVSKGGCEPDVQPEIQLGRIIPTDSSVDVSVDLESEQVTHATDDSDLTSEKLATTAS